MKAPRCKLDGLWMRYEGRSRTIIATVPLGDFWCKKGHCWTLVLPWSWEGGPK